LVCKVEDIPPGAGRVERRFGFQDLKSVEAPLEMFEVKKLYNVVGLR
jgi:hypothetical protein